MPQANKIDQEVLAIKAKLDKGEKEMKEIVFGLCQWNENLL